MAKTTVARIRNARPPEELDQAAGDSAEGAEQARAPRTCAEVWDMPGSYAVTLR